jgi:hypothetical protein
VAACRQSTRLLPVLIQAAQRAWSNDVATHNHEACPVRLLEGREKHQRGVASNLWRRS